MNTGINELTLLSNHKVNYYKLIIQYSGSNPECNELIQRYKKMNIGISVLTLPNNKPNTNWNSNLTIVKLAIFVYQKYPILPINK